MSLIGRKSRKKARAEKLEPTADEEYEVVAGEHSKLQSQIQDLEGFIDEAPQIRERRQRETRVTLPPVEDDTDVSLHAEVFEDETDEEDLQDRLGRRHLAAIRRSRRRNFCIFLISASLVAAFLYWVSLVVR